MLTADLFGIFTLYARVTLDCIISTCANTLTRISSPILLNDLPTWLVISVVPVGVLDMSAAFPCSVVVGVVVQTGRMSFLDS
jgi:hypothetical protein